MDNKDQAPIVLLALYAGTVTVPILAQGLNLALYAGVLGVELAGGGAGPSPDPVGLAVIGVFSLVGLARLVGALATAGFAGYAAWRLSTGDGRLARPAALAAATVSL